MFTPARPPSHVRPLPLKTFLYGTCYYPEHWDPADRAQDAARMAAAGFNTVRMAEFSASFIEPAPGQFDFRLFDDVIAELGRHGIKTILGTPTAAPPRWLTLAHPDAVQVDEAGRPMSHGSRQHVSISHPAMREYSQRVTRAMAEHYAENPMVIGWQTDNEFHCHFSEDHSEAAQEDFQVFLREKYGEIAKLNRAWGNVFWSLTYSDFTEIRTPKQSNPAYINPAHQLDYRRFLSWRVIRFQREQTEVLRTFQPKWFVFHNGCFAHLDYRGDFVRDLDFLAYDSYPFFSQRREERAPAHAFNLDRTRAWSGNFLIPEMQSGPGGQAPYFHDTPEPGEMRRMVHSSVARGADGVLFFRWRTCRFGAEMYWCGLLDHDNLPRRRYEEAAELGRELAGMEKWLLGTSVRMDVAVAHADFDALELNATLPMGLPGLSQRAEALHGWFFQEGYACGCAHPADDLSGLSLYILPNWEWVDPEWVPNLERFLREGGTLLIGARSGTRNADNQVIADTPPGCLAELAGVLVRESSRKNLADDRPWTLDWDGVALTAEDWVEILDPVAGTETAARWTSRFAAGEAAVTRRGLGKGQVLYAGQGLTAGWLRALGPRLCELANLKPAWPEIPAGVETVCRRGGGRKIWWFINHRDGAVELPALPEGVTLAGGEDGAVLPLNGVRVILQEED